jgi:dihydroxy-acid dehydratase
MGDEALDRPIVGITNTASDYNSCHGNAAALIAAVKRGIAQAGGIGFEFPVISLHESFAYPTSMYLRNLMAIDVEEMIRAQPMDAVVLIGGCDKTVPALLMGAASAGKPAILEVTGPMLTGHHEGERVGACTDCRRFWARYRAGEIDETEIDRISDQLGPTVGTCMVMGTASTMAICAEALGMILPGGAAVPAVYSERLRHAEATGSRAVALAHDPIAPDRIMTAAAFRNALRTLLAIGGSTNALIHLTAVAGRLGIPVALAEFEELSQETPLLVDLKPSGEYYMQELHEAGGFATIRHALAEQLDLDCLTISGQTHRELLANSAFPRQKVVRQANDPFFKAGSIAVLNGNLAPDGAIIKQSAATPHLLTHRGKAVVFDSLADLAERIDAVDLDVTPDSVLVLRNAGPLGAPGMPEAGYIPIPRKLAAAGIKDMVRISDARMSGTAFGTIVLHVAPEAALQGPLAWLETGDVITLDVPNRRLEAEVSAEEFERRRGGAGPPGPPAPERGYARLFAQEVLQAPEGCDFRSWRK